MTLFYFVCIGSIKITWQWSQTSTTKEQQHCNCLNMRNKCAERALTILLRQKKTFCNCKQQPFRAKNADFYFSFNRCHVCSRFPVLQHGIQNLFLSFFIKGVNVYALFFYIVIWCWCHLPKKVLDLKYCCSISYAFLRRLYM